MNDQMVDILLSLVFFLVFRLLHAMILIYLEKQNCFPESLRNLDDTRLSVIRMPKGSPEDAEWSSMLISTFHSTFVIYFIFVFLGVEGHWTKEEIAYGTTADLRILFDFSIGYFIHDSLLMFWWRMENWEIMTFHHLVAATPYMVYNFVLGCYGGLYILTLFLLVEICTIPLNLKYFFEKHGFGSKPVTISFYCTIISWIPCRLVLPIYNLVILYTVVIPLWWSEKSHWQFGVCVMPSVTAAHIITLFCWGVFFAKWVPELKDKWTRSDSQVPIKRGTPHLLSEV
mmetsp:Transcript_2768/g.3938  ORF Transcript_2768/g.3938 Transcript_2768/m.3938 type:complete len:285 (+) Transcript_2768:79-933(+)